MKPVRLVSLLLCAAQVFSLPVSSVDSEDDTKVMKCIVEVISDTLSKPKPAPITQDCLQTLRGDERIISILRHQNLLKDLQQLAAQGALERLQQSKKSGGAEELSGVLDKRNKASSSEASEESSRHTRPSESEEAKRQPEKETEEKSSERPQEGNSAEELENNDISKTEETPEDEDEIDNHITDEINNMELPRDNGEDSGEDREAVSKKVPEDQEPADHDKEQDSNDTENEEDDTQREDNSMKIPEDFNKDEPRPESSKEDDHSEQTPDCSDDETSSKDLEDAKRWNKMDELAKELRAKRCAKRAASEEEPDRSMKSLPKGQKDEPGREEQEDVGQQQQSPTDSNLQMSKRPDERKEEGSTHRKAEEPDSLAAIEAELENVAHKLHDLRRG